MLTVLPSFHTQKQQQQQAANAQGGGQKKKKVTAAQLRVQKGMWGRLFSPFYAGYLSNSGVEGGQYKILYIYTLPMLIPVEIRLYTISPPRLGYLECQAHACCPRSSIHVVERPVSSPSQKFPFPCHQKRSYKLKKKLMLQINQISPNSPSAQRCELTSPTPTTSSHSR